jgi:hypothetical protein
MPVKANRK